MIVPDIGTGTVIVHGGYLVPGTIRGMICQHWYSSW